MAAEDEEDLSLTSLTVYLLREGIEKPANALRDPRRLKEIRVAVGTAAHRTLPDADARYLARLATDRGWLEIAEHFASSSQTFEQQTQQSKLP